MVALLPWLSLAYWHSAGSRRDEEDRETLRRSIWVKNNLNRYMNRRSSLTLRHYLLSAKRQRMDLPLREVRGTCPPIGDLICRLLLLRKAHISWTRTMGIRVNTKEGGRRWCIIRTAEACPIPLQRETRIGSKCRRVMVRRPGRIKSGRRRIEIFSARRHLEFLLGFGCKILYSSGLSAICACVTVIRNLFCLCMAAQTFPPWSILTVDTDSEPGCGRSLDHFPPATFLRELPTVKVEEQGR